MIYYVKNGGDDLNDGLTDATAWEHHPWMQGWGGAAITLLPGDTVCLKKGDSWVYSGPQTNFIVIAESGTADNYITLTSYGEGAKPLLHYDTQVNYSSLIYGITKSYIIINDLEIKQYSSTFVPLGSYGIYLTNIAGVITGPCHDIEITNCDIHEIPHACVYVYGDSYNITVGYPGASVTATPDKHSNHLYNWGYAGVIMMGTNPETLITNNIVNYNYIHSSTRTGLEDNAYGIIFTGGSNSTAWPKECFAKYNHIEDIISWHGIDTHGGSYYYFQYNYIKNAGRRAVCLVSADLIPPAFPTYNLPAKLDNIFVEHNVIEIDPLKVYDNSGIGQIALLGHEGKQATNIYIRRNTLSYITSPLGIPPIPMIGIENVWEGAVSGNKIYNGSLTPSNWGAIVVYTDVQDVVIEGNYVKDHHHAITWNGKAISGGKLIIKNNILTNCGIANVIDPFEANGVVEIYNNQFLYFESHHDILAGALITLRNNIIGGFGDYHREFLFEMWEAEIYGTLDSDYNLFTTLTYGRPVRFHNPTQEFTAAQWQAMGRDVNSVISADPLYVNASGMLEEDTDLKLGEGSPAINKGVDVDVDNDYAGNDRIGVPDIGPYEYAIINTDGSEMNGCFSIPKLKGSLSVSKRGTLSYSKFKATLS